MASDVRRSGFSRCRPLASLPRSFSIHHCSSPGLGCCALVERRILRPDAAAFAAIVQEEQPESQKAEHATEDDVNECPKGRVRKHEQSHGADVKVEDGPA